MFGVALLALLYALWRRKATKPIISPSIMNQSVCEATPRRRGFAALVGNSKLIRLHSLSQQTGCEILVRALVWT